MTLALLSVVLGFQVNGLRPKEKGEPAFNSKLLRIHLSSTLMLQAPEISPKSSRVITKS